MVRILTQNHHLDLLKRCRVKCRKNLSARRKHLMALVLLTNKIRQLLEVWRFPFSGKHAFPRGIDTNIHNSF